MVKDNLQFKYYKEPDDKGFYEDNYVKKEFYLYRQRQPELGDNEVEELTDMIEYDKPYTLLQQQELLRNYISPETPYKNVLIFHGVGVGKTLTAVSIAEGFRDQIHTMNLSHTKSSIYIIALESAKNNFIDELLLHIEKPYITQKDRDKYIFLKKESVGNPSIEKKYKEMRKELKKKLKKEGNYIFHGYTKFQRLTIGAKVKKPTEEESHDVVEIEGSYFKKSRSDKAIDSLSNSIIIIDEAHRMTDNFYGTALRYMLKKSENTIVILLTATPMMNKPQEIVELLNFVLPQDKQLTIENVFKSGSGELSEEGETLLRNNVRGYVSYLRGYNPDYFPIRIDMGVVPKPIDAGKPNFRWTKVVRCPMTGIQLSTYNQVIKNNIVAREGGHFLLDMVFPNPDKTLSKKGFGIYMKRDLELLDQVSPGWLRRVGIELIRDPYSSTGQKEGFEISGSILEEKNLKRYSIKYWTILQNINHSVGKNFGTHFIYNGFVEWIGVKLLRQILLRNGYAEYDPSNTPDSQGMSEVRCYNCGLIRKRHPKRSGDGHIYFPAQFITLFGGMTPEQRKSLLDTFNDMANVDGRMIKIVLGSIVTKESINILRVTNIHIVNYQDNFSTLEQIIGRGVRFKSHVGLPLHKRKVYIWKYVSSMPSINGRYKMSAEEKQYLDDEQQSIYIKRIERVLKESAFDCSFNKYQNMFERELREQKRTGKSSILCDYQKCNYECEWEPNIDSKLSRGKILPIYEKLKLHELDTTTYKTIFYRPEVSIIKKYIKELFTRDIAFNIDTIIYQVKEIGRRDDHDYIEDRYIYIALEEMLNDKSKDYIINQNGDKGYLIYRGKYYIFQPTGEKENILLNQRLIPLFKQPQTVANLEMYFKSKGISTVEAFNKEKFVSYIIKHDSTESRRIAQKQTLEIQQGLLEQCIEWLNTGEKLSKQDYIYMKKMLEIYRLELINSSDLLDASGRSYSGVSKIGKEELEKLKGKDKIVGHFLSDKPRCFINGEFKTCSVSMEGYEDSLRWKEQFIVGVVEKTHRGLLLFKLRYPKKDVRDKRKQYKGWVCSQSNDKQMIRQVALRLGLTLSDTSSIKSLCRRIEDELRKRQDDSIKYNKKDRWFYSYGDVLRAKSLGIHV